MMVVTTVQTKRNVMRIKLTDEQWAEFDKLVESIKEAYKNEWDKKVKGNGN